MKAIYLKPHSAFNREMRSDTLWGLLCWGIRHVYSEKTLEDFLKKSEHSEFPFLNTSAFPFIKTEKGEVIRYLPKPTLRPHNWVEYLAKQKSNLERVRAQSALKAFKKLSLVTESDFRALVSGSISEEELFNSFLNYLTESSTGNPVQNLRFNASSSLFTAIDSYHNTINRLTGTTLETGGGLFSKTVYFAKDGGLFFLMRSDNEDFALITSSLRFLSHFGFGGDSSVGVNHFGFEIEEIAEFSAKNANAVVSLSLYAPTSDELSEYEKKKENLFYELDVRKGKVGGRSVSVKNFWKTSRVLFREGSVFPILNKSSLGEIYSLHRNEFGLPFKPRAFGKAFTVPITMEQ